MKSNSRLCRAVLMALVSIATAGPASAGDGNDKASPSDDAPRVRLIVPAYFYPADNGLKEWDRLIAAADRVPIVVIVNPASGPGKEADANYVKVLNRAKEAKKITLIGYVTTSYGKRKAEDVQAEVDRYIQMYPAIQGVFFDEQASDADHVKYQAGLYEYARKKRGLKLVVTNPGTVCAEEYLSQPAADIACLFEEPKPFDPSKLPGWVAKYSRDHIAVLPYKVGSAKAMQEVIKLTVEKKIGYCYVNDTEGANPWERLPKYWDEEVAAVSEANKK